MEKTLSLWTSTRRQKPNTRLGLNFPASISGGTARADGRCGGMEDKEGGNVSHEGHKVPCSTGHLLYNNMQGSPRGASTSEEFSIVQAPLLSPVASSDAGNRVVLRL